MICFDLDGTLLTSDKSLSERTKEALLHAVEMGIHIVPATGRPASGLPEQLMKIPGIRYVITSNGARVLDCKEDALLFSDNLPVEKARKVLDIFEEYDTLREIYYDGIGYADQDRLENVHIYMKDPAVASYICKSRRPVKSTREKFEEENRGLDKIQAVFASMEERQDAWDRIRQSVDNVTMASALLCNIEVNDGCVNKGAALLKLAQILGIKREEVMAFGDGDNDTRMLEAAGIGVAMGNAVEEVKLVADIIAPSNDQDGVAKIIEQYIL